MRVPLVVVTGFLGAGKTTLVNRLLARRAARGEDGSKLGVIVNELGEVGIDGALIGSASAKQIELPGGCVCCVLGEELDRTLIELVDGNPGMQAVVLETTGVAEPLPISWAVEREGVRDRVRLAAVVTLVDATHFRASRGVSVAADAQVAYADVVLLTKEPLAGAAETEAVLAAVRTLAPHALIRRGTTDEHALWLESILADPPLRAPAGPPVHGEPGHVHDDSCREADTHAHGIDSLAVEVPGVIDLEELEDRLGELPASYVRIKGIALAVDGRAGDSEPRWIVVHRVGPRVSSEPLPARPEGFDAARGRLVALGSDLHRDVLANCIAAALR